MKTGNCLPLGCGFLGIILRLNATLRITSFFMKARFSEGLDVPPLIHKRHVEGVCSIAIETDFIDRARSKTLRETLQNGSAYSVPALDLILSCERRAGLKTDFGAEDDTPLDLSSIQYDLQEGPKPTQVLKFRSATYAITFV
jgi:hypothetical protein